MLVATKWNTVEDKEKFIKHFKRFVLGGFRKTIFHKWFYTRLSLCFGFIAHYNKHGFYEEKFSSVAKQIDFLRSILDFPCYGDPAYTYSDAERIIRQWVMELVTDTTLREGK